MCPAGAAGAAGSEKTPFSESLESAGFERLSTRHGVRVFKHRAAEDIRIAGEGSFPASPERVRALLLDYERHAGRVPRLRESRVVRREPGSMLVYQRLDLPVVSDRDFVLRVRHGTQGPDLWLTYEAEPGDAGVPEVDGVVRVRLHSGSWQLRPLRDGQATFARYQTRIDVAGSMPKWMARSRAGSDIPGLFRALCRMLDAGACR